MLRSVTAFALTTAGILLVASGPVTAQRNDGFETHRDAAPIDSVSNKSGQPAMFQVSFILHAFGNDTTTGASYPFNTYVFTAMPLGRDCQSPSPYTPNGWTRPRYCSPAIMQQGVPATGSGTLVTGPAALATVALPQSAFRVTATGFMPDPYGSSSSSYMQTHTYATFVNALGSFFVGGGPAAGLGQKVKTGMGRTSGSWVINEGARGFGGVLGLLGRIGASSGYIVSGKPGTYEGTGNWNMVTALGRPRSESAYSYTPMGKTNWFNPHVLTNTYANNINFNTNAIQVRASGTPWTTGSVTVYAIAGVFQTILHRAGHDTTTTGGARNLQLVTPALTHWIGPGFQDHTGHIGILELTLSPEPGALFLLAAGLGTLLAVRRLGRGRRV